jgi:hypothetical protein
MASANATNPNEAPTARELIPDVGRLQAAVRRNQEEGSALRKLLRAALRLRRALEQGHAQAG